MTLSIGRYTKELLVIGFVAPAQFGHSNPLTYAVLILAGIAGIGILPPLLLGQLRKPGWKATNYRSASAH